MPHAYTSLTLDYDDAVARLTLNRPDKANAMNLAFWEELPKAMAEIDANDATRVAVIRGAGRNFSAGIDIQVLSHLAGIASDNGCPARAREKIHGFIRHAQTAFNAIEACRVPVIAAVQGACYGGAVDMIAACDVRLCSADARFCIKEVDLAVVPDVGTLQRLRHIIGFGVLTELSYTAEVFDAAAAQRIGLVTQHYEDADRLRDAATTLARTIAEKSPLAVRGIKRNLIHARDHDVNDGLAYTAVWNSAMLISEDAREALSAQAGKRPPKFAD